MNVPSHELAVPRCRSPWWLSLTVLTLAPLLIAASPADLGNRIKSQRSAVAAARQSTTGAAEAIERQVLGAMDRRREKLLEQVRGWREDRVLEIGSNLDLLDVKEIERGVAEARALAAAKGLDVARLDRLYERAKTIIRESSFAVPGRPDYAHGESLTIRLTRLFVLARDYEAAIAAAEDRLDRYKGGLYKLVSFAYIETLLGADQVPGGCDPTGGPIASVEVDGRSVPSFGCQDLVIDKLRGFVDALAKIQEADTDALAAEAITVQAQQQLTADLITGVPLVGEALDLYAVYEGEDLAGRKLPSAIRPVLTLLIMLPIVNSSTVQKLFDQAAKRSKTAAVAFESLNDYFRAVEYTASDGWYAFKWGTRGAASAVYKGAAKQLGIASDQLKPLIRLFRQYWKPLAKEGTEAAARAGARIDYSDPMFRMQSWRKLREAIEGKLDVEALPRHWRERASRNARRRVQEGLLDAQGSVAMAIRRSNMLPEHADGFLRAARESDQILITRPVNPKAAERMKDLLAATKHMHIKSKSASRNPIAALIPVDQRLNKVGSELEELMARRQAGGSASEMARLDGRIADLQAGLAKGEKQMRQCLADPTGCAKAVVWKVDSPLGGQADLLVVRDQATGRSVFAIEGAGGKLIDPQTGKALGIVADGPAKKVQVLATPGGRPITADYDFLAFGRKDASYERLGNSPTMGGIARSEAEVVGLVNKYVDHPGGNVVHHGAEAAYFGSPGVDFPLTAFQPDGKVIHIPVCDAACMAAWCGRNPNRCRNGTAAPDPARLLKDYFHLKKLDGFNLDPNPNWNWGSFNPLSGFAARIHEGAL